MKDLVKNLAALFKVLGEQQRMKILKILGSNDEESLTVTDISRILKISQPSTSQHLRIMKSMDIVRENRKGFRVYYSLNKEILFFYKKLIDDTFMKGFTKCDYNYECSTCPKNETCM